MALHITLQPNQVPAQAIASTSAVSPTEKPKQAMTHTERKALGLPMEYVAESQLDKMAGSIRIEL